MTYESLKRSKSSKLVPLKFEWFFYRSWTNRSCTLTHIARLVSIEFTLFSFRLILNFLGQIKVSTDSFQRYWWSKSPEIRLDLRHTCSHLTKSDSLACPFHLMNISIQKIYNINSRDIVDKRTMQPDWMTGTPDHTQPKVALIDSTFSWRLTSCKKSKILIGSFQWHTGLKDPAIWLDTKHNWSHPTKRVSLRCYFPFMTNAMHRKLKYQLSIIQRYCW